MILLQCDENLLKIFNRFLTYLKIDAKAEVFSGNHADIAIIRCAEDVNRIDADLCIINSDDTELIKSSRPGGGKIITCGFGSRSTVTLSSLSDCECVICLQRSIKSVSGKRILPLEIPVQLCGIKFDDVSILMMITAALLCDTPVSMLNKIQL